MRPYHKIQSIYKRHNGDFLLGQYTCPEFEYLARSMWSFTEKIDGTNIRIQYDGTDLESGSRFDIGGRTDNAQIPTFLYNRLTEITATAPFVTVFERSTVTLYGEGYGNRIQSVGKHYLPDSCDFILFDVQIADVWLRQSAVRDIATALGIKYAPLLGIGDLQEAVAYTRQGFPSKLGDVTAEGLILRPTTELRDRMGRRVITKVKYVDFKGERLGNE